MRFGPALCLAILALLVRTVPVSAQPKDKRSLEDLGRTLAALATASPGNAKVGIAVIDVATQAVVFQRNGEAPMNPASNTKIVTAACALKTLGPEFRFLTSLHGNRDGSVIRGPIYLKGHADPTLSTEALWEMARELKAAGIRRVEGGVVVDDSYFDEHNLPYAYDQQKDEDAAFRAPVGAVSLNDNTLAITIQPGPQAIGPAGLFLDPPGYAVLVNDTVTVAKGANSPKISATPYGNRTKIRAWGQVPLGARPITYYRRVDNPSLLAGFGLRSVLLDLGISVGGDVQTGALPAGAPVLAEHRSAPLAAVLFEAGKQSNNFVAETVLKAIGAESKPGPGTWEAALAAAAEVLASWGLPRESYTFRNGSGLFDANRFSALQLAKIVVAAHLDSTIRPEFLSQLAIGGADGTIEARFADPAARRYVRAKTGTLDDVSALTGIVFDADGSRPVAFSIVVNDAPGLVSAARNYEEKLVTAIARFLH